MNKQMLGSDMANGPDNNPKAGWMRFILATWTAVILVGCTGGFPSRVIKNSSTVWAEPKESTIFQEARPGYMWEFPRDFGAHRAYQTEWWYYTGNLQTASGREFGYQFTIFRRGLIPGGTIPKRRSSWAADEIYMAHLTLSDFDRDAFLFYERFSRGALGLAGANEDPYRIWVEDWELKQENVDGSYTIHAMNDEIGLDLKLVDEKGIVFHGLDGYSQKGPEAGDASMYYSQPRLKTKGNLRIGQSLFDVTGTSWKDHEFSTGTLASNQVGWDWFSLQLENGIDLMVYTLRTAEGNNDPASSGTLILADGTSIPLQDEQFQVVVLERWNSKESGTEYPSRWKIVIPEKDIELLVTPKMPDQEIRLAFVYWEGAVDISGVVGGVEVKGEGYVELTGYHSSMAGQF